MIWVYRRHASASAHRLAKVLKGIRLRDAGLIGTDRFTIPKGEKNALICWGEQFSSKKFAVLNGKSPIREKFNDAKLLQAKDIPTIQVRRHRPDDDQKWLPRESDHSAGADLIEGTEDPHYFAKWEPLVREYRVHMFQGLSIRAGRKVQRDDFRNPHKWIRSYDAGWDMLYDGVQPRQRQLARDACKALELDFGAVDIGERQDGSLIVLEVNRAPALDEGSTAYNYAEAIQEWVDGLERT